MTDARTLEPADFEGASLEDMRAWVEEGPGSDALYSNGDSWKSEDDFMRAVADRVRARMAKAKVSIESQSGDAMQNAVSPVVLWTEVTAENAVAQSQRMHEQGEAFSKVQAAIPKQNEEAPVPDDNWFKETWDSWTKGRTDAEAARAQNEKLRQEAVTAFNGYDNSSRGSVSASAVFTAPPPGGMHTEVGSGQHSSVGNQSTPSFRSGDPAGTTSSWADQGTGHTGHGYTPPPSHSVPPGNQPPSGYQPPPGQQPPGYQPPPPGQQPPDRTDLSRDNPPQLTNRRIPLERSQGLGRSPVVGPSLYPTPPIGTGNDGGTGRGPGGGGLGNGRGTTGGGSPRGLGGIGGGAGSGSGSGSGGGGRGSLAPGGSGGIGGQPGSGNTTSNPANATGARGGSGTAGGAAGTAGRGNQQKGEEDEEHYTPEFLKGDYGFFDDDLPKVAPPVFGDFSDKDNL